MDALIAVLLYFLTGAQLARLMIENDEPAPGVQILAWMVLLWPILLFAMVFHAKGDEGG